MNEKELSVACSLVLSSATRVRCGPASLSFENEANLFYFQFYVKWRNGLRSKIVSMNVDVEKSKQKEN